MFRALSFVLALTSANAATMVATVTGCNNPYTSTSTTSVTSICPYSGYPGYLAQASVSYSGAFPSVSARAYSEPGMFIAPSAYASFSATYDLTVIGQSGRVVPNFFVNGNFGGWSVYWAEVGGGDVWFADGVPLQVTLQVYASAMSAARYDRNMSVAITGFTFYDANGNQLSDVNATLVETVPEPGSLALSGMVLLLLALSAHRQFSWPLINMDKRG